MNDINFESIEIRPDIFPSKWHNKNLNREDVEWITGGINGPADSQQNLGLIALTGRKAL